MTVLADLANFVCGFSAQKLPAEQRAILRSHAADSIIAMVAGALSPDGKRLAVDRENTDQSEAIASASAIIRSTEADDIHLASCTTPSSIAVPVALMLAPDIPPQRVESAICVGVEIMVRLGLAIDGPSVLYRGIWPTCFAAPFAAAAVAARIWGLDTTTTAHALSLSLMMSAGRTGRFAGTPTGRWILLKAAVSNGLRAASAAREGFKGDITLLDGDWLHKAHGLSTQTDILAAGLDKSCALPGLSMKPFSTARQALAATQALLEFLDGGLSVDQIETIEVRVPEAYARMISQPVDVSVRSTGYVSAPFQMALAALHRDHLWDLDRSEVMKDPKLLELAGRISVVPSAELQSGYPDCWPAEIDVHTRDGVVTGKVQTVRGDANMPLSEEERREKALKLLAPYMDMAKAEKMWMKAATVFESESSVAGVNAMLLAAAGPDKTRSMPLPA